MTVLLLYLPAQTRDSPHIPSMGSSICTLRGRLDAGRYYCECCLVCRHSWGDDAMIAIGFATVFILALAFSVLVRMAWPKDRTLFWFAIATSGLSAALLGPS